MPFKNDLSLEGKVQINSVTWLSQRFHKAPVALNVLSK